MSTQELKGKVAVITGASKGIGLAIARRLAEDGADIALVARASDTLQRSADTVETAGVRAIAVAADLATLDGCQQAAEQASSQLGRVDILVNCAGDTRAGNFPSQPDEDWLSGFALKFHGAVRLSRLLWPELARNKGTVINIGGAAAYTPGAGFMIGGSVNAALAHFSKSLSKQGLIDDVNVNIIHPGMTVSDRMEALLIQQAEAEGVPVEDIRLRNLKSAGIRRLGEPEDIAEAVAFLCSPRARHIQGIGLAIDGGATPGLTTL